jgi:hypothetical protein
MTQDVVERLEELAKHGWLTKDETAAVKAAASEITRLRELSRDGGDDYRRGQRDALSAVLSLNPVAAAKVAHWAEKEPDPQGRMPFDVALWVSVVAEQLGFETLEDDGPDRFKASSPTGQDDRDAIIEMCAEVAETKRSEHERLVGQSTEAWSRGYYRATTDCAYYIRSLKFAEGKP